MGNLPPVAFDRPVTFKYKYVLGYCRLKGKGTGPVLTITIGGKKVWARAINLAAGEDYPYDKGCGGKPTNYSPIQSSSMVIPKSAGGEVKLSMVVKDRNIHVVGDSLKCSPQSEPAYSQHGCKEKVSSGDQASASYSAYPACVDECEAKPDCNAVRWISKRYKGSWKPHGWCQGLPTCTPNKDKNWNTMSMSTDPKGAKKAVPKSSGRPFNGIRLRTNADNTGFIKYSDCEDYMFQEACQKMVRNRDPCRSMFQKLLTKPCHDQTNICASERVIVTPPGSVASYSQLARKDTTLQRPTARCVVCPDGFQGSMLQWRPPPTPSALDQCSDHTYDQSYKLLCFNPAKQARGILGGHDKKTCRGRCDPLCHAGKLGKVPFRHPLKCFPKNAHNGQDTHCMSSGIDFTRLNAKPGDAWRGSPQGFFMIFCSYSKHVMCPAATNATGQKCFTEKNVRFVKAVYKSDGRGPSYACNDRAPAGRIDRTQDSDGIFRGFFQPSAIRPCCHNLIRQVGKYSVDKNNYRKVPMLKEADDRGGICSSFARLA